MANSFGAMVADSKFTPLSLNLWVKKVGSQSAVAMEEEDEKHIYKQGVKAHGRVPQGFFFVALIRFSICSGHVRRQEAQLQTRIPVSEIALHTKRRKTQLLWSIIQSSNIRRQGRPMLSLRVLQEVSIKGRFSICCGYGRRRNEPPLRTKNSARQVCISPIEKENSTAMIDKSSNLRRHSGRPQSSTCLTPTEIKVRP